MVYFSLCHLHQSLVISDPLLDTQQPILVPPLQNQAHGIPQLPPLPLHLQYQDLPLPSSVPQNHQFSPEKRPAKIQFFAPCSFLCNLSFMSTPPSKAANLCFRYYDIHLEKGFEESLLPKKFLEYGYFFPRFQCPVIYMVEVLSEFIESVGQRVIVCIFNAVGGPSNS